jgi:hypothetical protein
LDWAIERFLALALNPLIPEILASNPMVQPSDLKFPILNQQIEEPNQRIKAEYNDVIKLLLDRKKVSNPEAKCTNLNNESYSLIQQNNQEGLRPYLQYFSDLLKRHRSLTSFQ